MTPESKAEIIWTLTAAALLVFITFIIVITGMSDLK
jgi:hypothetical protein